MQKLSQYLIIGFANNRIAKDFHLYIGKDKVFVLWNLRNQNFHGNNINIWKLQKLVGFLQVLQMKQIPQQSHPSDNRKRSYKQDRYILL